MRHTWRGGRRFIRQLALGIGALVRRGPGRKLEARGSIPSTARFHAHRGAALPGELRTVWARLEEHFSSGESATIATAELLVATRLGPTAADQPPMTLARLVGAKLDRIGVAFEPDRRYGPTGLSAEGVVVLFRFHGGAPVDGERPEYATARKAVEAAILKALRKQLRDGILSQKTFSERDLDRCVYVVRMTGSVLIAYPWRDSPVLYVGRGQAPKRLATHLKNWLHDAHRFGSKVGIELRICVPRRTNRADFFKNVEADLIDWFEQKNGAIPFFNS